MKVVTILGARPQFIKAAAVTRAIRDKGGMIGEIIVHTGQHFDANMSDIFFQELGIPAPAYNLGITADRHGEMTGRMLTGIEEVLYGERPDAVLVYGDTNSTLAGALAAAKMHIPVAHVEAGLRSFNRLMPEEINRIVADRLSSLLFCPSDTAVDNLHREGIIDNVHNVGDVMYDAILHYRKLAASIDPARCWSLGEKQYVVCTVHRAENTDSAGRLRNILAALGRIAETMPVVLPLHPRTKKMAAHWGIEDLLTPLTVLPPVGYLEMIRLQAGASCILTDSGGMQKEAFFLQVPCLTLRDETEWVETVASGWNTLCGADEALICKAWQETDQRQRLAFPQPYGDGRAAEKIADLLLARHPDRAA